MSLAGTKRKRVGECTLARVELLVFVALNMVTDVMLIIIPLPWLARLRLPIVR
jgi:hypothetical protein